MGWLLRLRVRILLRLPSFAEGALRRAVTALMDHDAKPHQ
jgi:hypothetical protein